MAARPDRRRLSRAVARGPASARGSSRASLPAETGRHYRPDTVVERADEMAGEVDRDTNPDNM